MKHKRSKLLTTRRTLACSILLLALAFVAMLASTGSLTFETLFNRHFHSSSPSISKRPTPESPNETRARLERSYGQLPLSFEANQGQTDPKVKFLSRGRGYTMFLTSRAETALVLRKPSPKRDSLHAAGLRFAAARPEAQPDTPPVVVRMKLDGANATPHVDGLEELPGKANYFIGNDPAKWRTNVPTYARVKYHAVYPGVDLVYYGNQQQLEHDFVVTPGASPSAITLGFEGAEKLSLDAQGDLVLATKNGEVQLQKPVCYQLETNGAREETAGSYVLKGKNQVGFEIAAYDASKPLVIDPVLVYSTYLGGSNIDEGVGIAVDSVGNAYVTGLAISTNFPTTGGAFQTTLGGGQDAFVTKLDPTGSGLVYSTYLGGSTSDSGLDIAVDSAGSAYVSGSTISADFPTTVGAFQTTYRGNQDAFVTKLNPTGSALAYSTYLGGTGVDFFAYGIAVDSIGNAYVTGDTQSTDFPTTLGAFQTTSGGNQDAFVTKLNALGTLLLYSTYLGGTGFESGNGIAVDSADSAYVIGRTTSTDFPTTSGAFQMAFGGVVDAFVTKLNVAGSALVYSTYLGGSSDFEEGEGIAVDSIGNAYVTGETASNNFPTTGGAFQTTYGGGYEDAFVTKLNASGSAPVYSTYLGGSGNDQGFGIRLDSAGSAYVTGGTDSTNFPVTSGALQMTSSGGFDAYMTKLNPAGSGLVYSTYLGGSGFDRGDGIAVDSAGSAYMTGETTSNNFPTTSGAFQTALSGSEDAFVTKIGGLGVGPSTPGKVTGGGFIQPDGTMSPATLLIQHGNNASLGDKATFGFVVQFNAGDTNPTGNLTYDDHAANVRIKALSYNLLFISQGPCGPNTRATFRGSATVTGPLGVSTQDFEVQVDDCGEPGSSPGAGPDMFMITTLGTTPYMAAGPLVGGNIQVRSQ
jgi:hypothetical protein